MNGVKTASLLAVDSFNKMKESGYCKNKKPLKQIEQGRSQ